MSRKRRTLRWVLGALGALLFLLLAFLLIAPRLINLEPVRKRVLAGFSEKLGGQVEYGSIALSILPRPCMVLHEGRLSIPGRITGTLKTLTLYPEVLPLLKGDVRFSRIQADTPDFKLNLPKQTENDEKGKGGFSPAFLEKKMAPLLAVTVLDAPDLIIQVERGKLTLTEGNNPWLSFQDIDARIGLPPDTLRLEITCESNLFRGLSFTGSLDSKDFKGEGHLILTGLRPELLIGPLLPEAPIQLSDSEMDLSAGFKIDGLKTLRTDLDARIPSMIFHRGNEELVVKGAVLKGTFYTDGDETRVSLTQLDMDYPRIKLTGKFQVTPGEPRVSLELEGNEIDVPSFRKAALSIAGDMPLTREIFSIVKGGQVPVMTLKMEGNSTADLGKLGNILIKGRILGGKIFVPEAALDLEAVKGDVVISKGILQGKGLAARLGKTQGSQGNLKLGLAGDPAPFHLNIMVKAADLAEVKPILTRLIKNKSVVREMDLIEGIKGNATARLILGENTASIKPRVTVTELGLSAKYGRVPYPLAITGGQVSFKGTNLSVKDFSGKLGNSGFSKLSGRVDWERDPFLEVTSGSSDILLNEIYPWVSSLKGVGGRLKGLKDVKGGLTLSSFRLKGPVSRPQNWDFQVTGEANQVSVDMDLLGGPAELTRAKFDATEKNFSFKDAHINLLDGSLDVSGGLNGYTKDLDRVHIRLAGDLGPEILRRFSGFVNMPSYLTLPSPLSISKSNFVWRKGGEVGFTGNLDVKEGPQISLDIVHKNGHLAIKKLDIKDKNSSAVMGFDLSQKEVGVKFSGNLEGATLDRFLSGTRFPTGSISGDFETRFERDRPMKFVASGKLEGSAIVLPWKVGETLKVQRFSLSAEENRFSLEPAIIEWGDTRLVFEGKAGLDEDKMLLDMDLTINGLDAEKLSVIAREENEKGILGEGKGAWALPLRGELRVKCDSLKYQSFICRPLHVNLSFESDGIAASVVDANLCGIATPGTLRLSDRGLQLDFKPVVEGQELNPTIFCLTDRSTNMDGTFDLRGEVKGKGMGHDLARSLHGSFEFVARNGHIYRDKLVAGILAVLNVTEIFKGKLPDLGEEGLAYHSITVKGNFEEGKLHLKKIVMDGATMDLAGKGDIDLFEKKVNLIILASFLKTVNSIVKMIPLVNYILDGTLVSIPIKVTGNLENPEVDYVSASAVGSGLIGIMERTLKLPIKVIEPVLPKKKESQAAPQN
ncbi:MAG: AsmA-like C-terminal domain-containing protein [Desulfobacteraceae bacterium]|nr:AsmA-like C-terminal domain-containing protein [Desulfobacteraceae bacterium]